jgi:hypothetical protein
MGELLNILKAIERGEKEQPSTGVAEAGGQVFIRNRTSADAGIISSSTWSVLKDLGEEAGMVSQVLYQSVKPIETDGASGLEDLSHNRAEVVPVKAASTSKDTASPDWSTSASKKSFKSKISLKNSLFRAFTYLAQGPPSSSMAGPTDRELNEMFSVINQAMQVKDWDKVSYLLDDMIFLITTDTGGQAEFLDLHASLVQGPSLNLLFSRLVDDLDSLFEVYYTSKEGESTEREDSIMTEEEVLFQCLASVACFSGTFREANDDTSSGEASLESKPFVRSSQHSQSKVLFVGTYRDKVSQEQFKRKDDLLQRKIKGTPFYEKGIIEFVSEDQLILPVDNISGGQDEIDRIRLLLESIIKKSFEKITIPASWLVLSLQIRSKRQRTMSLEKCGQLARKLGISPTELQDALWFLHHHVGVLMYYPEVECLQRTVICDIQVVFDSTTNLIKNVFTFDRVGHSISKTFREKGQFSLSDVREATLGYTDSLIPLRKLVELLEYLSILTPIPSSPSSDRRSRKEPTYFMPCVLRSARPSELTAYSQANADPAPLMLRYDCGYMPVGIFPSMITNLVSQELKDWELVEKNIRKNRVQFLVGKDYDTITLISHPRFFEIAISRSEDFQTPPELLCSHVRGVIQSTLSTVTSRMNYDFSMGYKFSFECPSHPGREHLCVLANEKARRMKCLQDQQETIPLQPHHQRWFSSAHEGML